jgi:hypothetical protein
MSNKAIESRDKSAKIYIGLGIAFIAIFSTITILALFFSALNF